MSVWVDEHLKSSSLKGEIAKGYLVPTTIFTTWPADVPAHLVIWLDRSSNDVLSVKEKRKRTASTCSWQDWKTHKDQRLRKNIWCGDDSFPTWICFIRTGNKWPNLRKAFSPQSHSCRRKNSTLPLSLSFTGQCTTVVSIPGTTKHKLDERLWPHYLLNWEL